LTVGQAADAWFDGVSSGKIRQANGDPYKPSTLRSYKSSFDTHVRPALGDTRLNKLRRRQVQELVERLTGAMHEHTVRNAITPLRSICRRAHRQDVVISNPCSGIELPRGVARRFAVPEAGGNGREQVATRDEAASLIAVLPNSVDRAIWATAFYAGLRRGELRGLRACDVDLGGKTLTVSRSWDALDGEIAPKSYTSARQIPLSAPLAAILEPYLSEHDGGEFAFPGRGRWGCSYGPFSADALLKRSRKVWKSAGLEPIGLHEARHTYASILIDGGLPLVHVSRFLGHSSTAITERVYVHLMPDSLDAARALIDACFTDSPIPSAIP
jgi:integrase